MGVDKRHAGRSAEELLQGFEALELRRLVN
jgi:hypothetical protein